MPELMMKANRKLRRVARRLFRQCRVDGRLDAERVRVVAQRIAGSGRRGTLAILGDLLRLVRLDRDAHRAIVESATPLPDDMRNDVQSGLARVYGQGIETSFGINPRLIGGMRIQVGSDVYDASVRAKLAALEARL
jgi:F-type H+-transporting ATPase subunit delta